MHLSLILCSIYFSDPYINPLKLVASTLVSFYVSTANLFFLHCDEWDRVVALPRHKFVTGATLLQLINVVSSRLRNERTFLTRQEQGSMSSGFYFIDLEPTVIGLCISLILKRMFCSIINLGPGDGGVMFDRCID
jgi:hypothetical protein